MDEKGAAAWADGAVLQIPTRPARVVDTTGAGDTFNGAQGVIPTWDRVMECVGFKEF